MSRPTVLALALLALAGCTENVDMVAPQADLQIAEGPRASDVAPRARYEVTVENITTAGGQYFTPPLMVVSQKAEDLFTPGMAASAEIMQIAENGNLGPMVAQLGDSKHVSSFDVAFAVTDPEPFPPLAPGASVTRELYGDPGSNFFSFVSMLICTNDGFTGVDGAKLPEKIGDEIEIYAGAYDAGTETNTEDAADLVPPCQSLGGAMADDMEPGTDMSNPALAEGGVIRHHPGILGLDDLDPMHHGWGDYVAKVTLRRIG